MRTVGQRFELLIASRVPERLQKFASSDSLSTGFIAVPLPNQAESSKLINAPVSWSAPCWTLPHEHGTHAL